MEGPEIEWRIIQYKPFISFVHPSFWHALTEIKIDVDKLDDTTRKIHGRYTSRDDVGTVFEVDGTSFNSEPERVHQYLSVTGAIMNKNTIEEFKNEDKGALLNSIGEMIWENIQSKDWIHKPSTLVNFFILSFADLKKFQYYYWFAFPAPSEPVVYATDRRVLNAHTHFSNKQFMDLTMAYSDMDISQRGFFVVTKQNYELKVLLLSEVFDYTVKKQNFDLDLSTTYFVFTDPSDNCNPGWPLRMFFAAILEHCPNLGGAEIYVVSLRRKKTVLADDSVIFKAKLPDKLPEKMSWIGWERNDKGNFGPRHANMAPSMDPVKLAETSADLNIRLMKWRLAPELDIDLIKKTKCLLIGSGTLGCHVARSLLAWGFNTITFLDSGKVSFSNPTRQSLFTHKDCLNGGRPKAEAAARNLKKILPSVDTYGIVLHIPMPGHPVGESMMQETLHNIRVLTEAILNNDVIFLLLDSREARWLPTVIAAYYEKVVITAALGFDSYLVMRHGDGSSSAENTSRQTFLAGGQLSCYFCNDVTSPGNSSKDRTLDQQCTVTRPGVSAMAAATAVEMLVALLHHPLKEQAPAVYNIESKELPSNFLGSLGHVPHTIRGFLHSYHMMSPTCARFKQCIACSSIVLGKYVAEGNEFLMKVFNSAQYLENVTGLTALHLAAELSNVLAFMSDEDDYEEEDEDDDDKEKKAEGAQAEPEPQPQPEPQQEPEPQPEPQAE